MSPSRRRLVTVLGLVAVSLFCVVLVLFRFAESGSTNFMGLIWNLFLGSVGIYLGRFLRLNSWDAVEHPSLLPRIAHAVARDPFTYGEAIGVTVLFTLALGFAYFLLYNFAVVGRELDVER